MLVRILIEIFRLNIKNSSLKGLIENVKFGIYLSLLCAATVPLLCTEIAENKELYFIRWTTVTVSDKSLQ